MYWWVCRHGETTLQQLCLWMCMVQKNTDCMIKYTFSNIPSQFVVPKHFSQTDTKFLWDHYPASVLCSSTFRSKVKGKWIKFNALGSTPTNFICKMSVLLYVPYISDTWFKSRIPTQVRKLCIFLEKSRILQFLWWIHFKLKSSLSNDSKWTFDPRSLEVT